MRNGINTKYNGFLYYVTINNKNDFNFEINLYRLQYWNLEMEMDVVKLLTSQKKNLKVLLYSVHHIKKSNNSCISKFCPLLSIAFPIFLYRCKANHTV